VSATGTQIGDIPRENGLGAGRVGLKSLGRMKFYRQILALIMEMQLIGCRN